MEQGPGAVAESKLTGQGSRPPRPTLGSELRNAQARIADAGIEDAALEAEVLLAQALELTRAELFARLDDSTDAEQRETFDALVARRLRREPLAYITGRREFYGLDLLCTPAALIPRPESEQIVQLALDWVEGQGSRVSEPVIVDVGTGTGALALAIAANAPGARVIAVDASRAALELARQNAERLGHNDRASFVQGSLLEPLRSPADIIVANLPYISDEVYGTLAPEIREYEPQLALRAGPRGTELVEALLTQAPALLKPGGLLLAEHAWDQGEALRYAARGSFPHARIETKRDLAGLERAVSISLQGAP